MTEPHLQRMLKRLDTLIACNSENPPGREAEAAAFVAAELKSAGFDVSSDDALPGRTNVVARLGNGPGPVFAFNSHLDTVPAGEGWTRSPFRMIREGERLYGRGACDAKGPIVAMMEAAELLAAETAGWSGDLLAVFVADEEVDSCGAKAFTRAKPTIDYVVIGEPTSNLVAAAHKGGVQVRVRIHGTAAHSSLPQLGVNAIFRTAKLLGMLEEHHETCVALRHPLVGAGSLSVTRIEGGIADNVVPDRCEILIDRRTVPGETDQAALESIRALLEEARRHAGIEAEIVSVRETSGGASETALDSPVVLASLDAVRTHGGAQAAALGFPGGCDLVHFRSTGAEGVVLGPGSLDVAHKPDEFVPVDELVIASLVYRDTALGILNRR